MLVMIESWLMLSRKIWWQFGMSDLGLMHYFLRIEVVQSSIAVSIS